MTTIPLLPSLRQTDRRPFTTSKSQLFSKASDHIKEYVMVHPDEYLSDLRGRIVTAKHNTYNVKQKIEFYRVN